MEIEIIFNFINGSEYMFKGINKIITSIKEGAGIEDDYEEDYDEEVFQESVEKSRTKQNRRYDYEEEDDYEEASSPSIFEKKKKTSKEEQKVIPIRKSVKSGAEVYVMMPKSFEEVQDICDRLISGAIVVLNLEALEPAEAQRISDFAFGTMHAINGKFRVVSKFVYIISPEHVELSAENEEELIDTLFSVPKINGQ